jgi:nicotinamide-nucleotide amidase
MYPEKDIAAIKDYMIQHHQTLAFAESVTSGHLQAAMSLADGATDFFQGGITTYNISQKVKHLAVDPVHAMQTNCVSQRVSEEMALHAAKTFSSDWAIAITGYAAPIPQLGLKDLFAIFAIAFHDKIILANKILTTENDLLKVQLYYTQMVLWEFSQYLSSLK